MIETSQLSGLEGNFQAQPRVFAHDAKVISIGAINTSAPNQGITVTSFGTGYSPNDIITTNDPGAAGTTPATIKVLTISGGGATGPIATYEITNPGSLWNDDGTEVISQALVAPTGGSGFTAVASNLDIPNTQQRGCCVYIGAGGNLEVVMEGGTTLVFNSLNAGTFLPILIKRIVSGNTTAANLIALY